MATETTAPRVINIDENAKPGAAPYRGKDMPLIHDHNTTEAKFTLEVPIKDGMGSVRVIFPTKLY